MSLPKVLIFGQAFNLNSGGGITLSNLFEGWDKNKIAVTCSGHMTNNLNTRICDSYYQIGSKEHQLTFPFNKFQKQFASGVLEINDNLKFNEKPYKEGFRKKFVDHFFYPLIKYFGFYHAISSIKLSTPLRQWLNEFRPDVLYVQVSERDGILFAQELYSFLKIPMVIHVMDDWPSVISSKGIFKKYWHKKIDKEFRELLNKASLLMSISDDMATEYKKRYNKDFVTFHNSIDMEFWKRYQKNKYDLNSLPEILYAGRVGIGIETSLELIAKAVQSVSKELKMSIKFVLQTQEQLSWFHKYDCVVHRPFISYGDLPQKFSEADLLILPYDFSPRAIRFIRFSMPTKAPEYMISGTPILIFAPEVTAIVRYAQKFKWAKIISHKKSSELEKAIKSLIQNKSERELIAANAKETAEANHSSYVITNLFKKTICSLSNDEFEP